MRRIHRRQGFLLGLVALVMVTAGCSSPAAEGTSEPGRAQPGSTTAPAAAHELVSKRYGFQVTVPKGWLKSDAQVAWDGKKLPDEPPTTNPVFANIRNSVAERKFVVTAAPVAKGMNLAAWQANIAGTVGADCVPGSVKKTTLGGEPALTWTEDCGDLQPTPIVALHGGRGYLAIAELNPPDPRIRASILRSFHFTG
jgi:hypothetical protein